MSLLAPKMRFYKVTKILQTFKYPQYYIIAYLILLSKVVREKKENFLRMASYEE
jgi:hypothetical protein